MTYPTVVKTWTISPNNRITFVSTNDTMAKYLFGVKAFLKTNGYTVKGSCDGTTGAIDGVDRWATSANVTTRGASAAAAQSWIILTDGNPVDILITYQGSTDAICRIAFSPGQLYVVAATANQQPTATDEVAFMSAGTSVVSASLDHLWNGWVDSTKKLCRFCIFRNSQSLGVIWGVELVNSKVSGPPAVFSPAVWGFSTSASGVALANGTQVGLARPLIASTAPTSGSCILSSEWFGASPTRFGNVQPDLQGGSGYPMVPLGVAMQNTGAVSVRGKLGQLYDTWLGRSSGATDGDTYGSLQFIAVGGYNGLASGAWPWDGVTTPVIS